MVYNNSIKINKKLSWKGELNMNSKMEMKRVRNYLRNQMDCIRKDPYLASVSGNLSCRIVKWDAKRHGVLICVRDVSRPEQKWDTPFCRWIWVHTYGSHWKWEVWKELNDVVVNMMHPDRIPF